MEVVITDKNKYNYDEQLVLIMERYTRNEITKQFIEIVTRVSGGDDITLNSSFNDLTFDELDMVECLIYSEKVFSIDIPDDKWFDLKTVRDAVDCIEDILEKIK